MVRHMHRSLAVLIVFAGALSVSAEERTFYKSVLPDGRVSYGDAPAAQARRTEKVTVKTDTSLSPADADAARRALQMSREQLLKNAEARVARLASLENEIAGAYDALKAAEARREASREVQEGDRQGRRFSPSYWERQREPEASLRQARQQLDRLLAERAALR